MKPFSSPPRVLVVDDEPGLRALLQWELGSRGMLVESARDGREAAELSKETGFDIVITDLTMPHADGFSVLESVKRDRPETPVIVATGFSTIEVAVRAMQRGAFDFVLKPFDVDQLVVRIQDALQVKARCRACGSAMMRIMGDDVGVDPS